MTHNLFTVRQPSAALNEPVEFLKQPRPIRGVHSATSAPSASSATSASSSTTSIKAKPTRLRGPLTLLMFSPRPTKPAKPAKPAKSTKSAIPARPAFKTSTAVLTAAAAVSGSSAPIMAKPIAMNNRLNANRTASQRSRIVAMSGLCLLLIVSGAWAAVNRPMSNVVGLPVTIRQNVPDINVTNAPPVNLAVTPAPGNAGETTLTTLSSFMTYKQQMDAARDQSISMLDALIADVNADATTLEQARGEKLALAKSISTEATLQGLMAARGFGDSYITVRPGSVNVVVRQDKLSNQQMASILEMVTAETGESPDNVKIVLTK